MRAVTVHQGQLNVEEVPAPVPGPGQVLVDVTRCGICGSDLHARQHADATADAVAEVGYEHFMRSDHTVVMGHEFTGRVAAYGPKTRKKWPLGTSVVALPILGTPEGIHLTGLTRHATGGYAEQVVVNESVTFEVPDGVSDDHAAMTEPLAVALHAVNRGGVKAKDTAVVIGCGPIGLAVILMLKASGVRTVIASDFSAGRRALAARCGADVVVNPAAESPVVVLRRQQVPAGPDRPRPVRARHHEAAAPRAAAAVATRDGDRPEARRSTARSGHLRVRGDARHHRGHRQPRSPAVPRRRGRRVHGAGHVPTGHGAQQGAGAAVRVRLRPGRVPPHA